MSDIATGQVTPSVSTLNLVESSWQKRHGWSFGVHSIGAAAHIFYEDTLNFEEESKLFMHQNLVFARSSTLTPKKSTAFQHGNDGMYLARIFGMKFQ
jgi:hypothetical protein